MWYGRGASRHDKERVEMVEVEVALVVEDLRLEHEASQGSSIQNAHHLPRAANK